MSALAAASAPAASVMPVLPSEASAAQPRVAERRNKSSISVVTASPAPSETRMAIAPASRLNSGRRSYRCSRLRCLDWRRFCHFDSSRRRSRGNRFHGSGGFPFVKQFGVGFAERRGLQRDRAAAAHLELAGFFAVGLGD